MARTLPNFCVVLCIACSVSFCVLFVCICVLYYCHRVATQWQLTNISYIISYHSLKYQSQMQNAIQISTIMFEFKVCQSVHHHTIQLNQPTRCNNLSNLLLDVYLQLSMFQASSRPSSGAQQLR